MEYFINMVEKIICYIVAKDWVAYQISTLIYNTKFKVKEGTTQTMTRIFFLDLVLTFFVESIFSLASMARKPIHLDMDIINMIR